MSWEDKINNIQFSIKTGDGKIYTPLWKTGETSKDFNATAFDFIDVSKSFIERKRPQSGKFPLTFWFQGEDNIEDSEDFYLSADDNRAWTVTHPFYGTIKGQPMSISRNDSNLNITEFTVDFWESIDANYPKSNISVRDNTRTKKDACLETASLAYSEGNFDFKDVQKNSSRLQNIVKKFENLIDDDNYSEYSKKYSDAKKAGDKLISNTLNAIETAQAVIDFPATLEKDVKGRLKAFTDVFNFLKSNVVTTSDKLYFQTQAATCIASYCNAAVNPLDVDFKLITEIQKASSDLISIYEQYVAITDEVSVGVYDIENTWQPDATVQSQLYDIVMFTVANLYNLSEDSLRERVFYTDSDTNIILLTHRYLGLDATDENLNDFKTINGLNLKELFKVKKGRKIIYYI
jgi:hypothetical protein